MKFLFIGAFLLLLGTSNAVDISIRENISNSTTQEMETGSGMDDTTVTEGTVVTTPRDPCLSDPCKNGGKCTADKSGNFTCNCLEGFEGALCGNIVTCSKTVVSSYAIYVQQNSTCGEHNVTDANEVVNFTFPSATYGQGYSTSLEECKYDCANLGPQPLAVAECQSNGKYTLITEVDCSVNPVDLPPGGEQLNYALVATSTSSDINTDTVDFALSATLDFTTNATSINDTDADNVMAINNNVVEGSSSPLSETDTLNIFESNGQLASKVIAAASTTTRSTLKSYTNVESRMALAVAEGVTTETYFILTLPDQPNLVYADLQLKNTGPTSSASYISATPKLNGRVSFAMYSSYKDLFENLDGLGVQTTVLSASGNASLFNFTFQMAGDFKNKLQCVRYVNGVWKDENDCTATYEGDYATCSCPTAGQYLMKSIVITEDPGLSAGAIVGIVIGCLVGIGLIGGGVYYYKKKCIKSSVSHSDEEEMKAKNNPAADLDDEDD